MYKKCIIFVFLILGITSQICFAENVQFESNSKSEDGNPLILDGILTKPNGKGPFPAVVLLHGCGGLEDGKPRSEAWSNRLVAFGYATLQLDSFAPRGIKDDCKIPSSIILRARAHDAYDAKSYLSELPYVDRNRIAVLGWSHGGMTVLNIIENTYRDDKPFKAAIAFYPWCSFLTQPNSPLMILIGESDDWTPAYRCSRAMPSMQTEHEIILKIYPGAYHDFDWEGMDETYGGHRVLYDPVATQDAIIQVKSFLAKHLK